ncbi:LytTR family transcriptional regulator, partial [Maribacter arcticus]
VKPITQERFKKSIKKITRLRTQDSKVKSQNEGDSIEGEDLYININNRLIKIKLNEILVIEAKGDYIEVKTENKAYLVHTTLKKILDKLPKRIFLQIHRSHIINFTKIIDIEDNSVLIAAKVLPVSRSNRPELMRRLNLL